MRQGARPPRRARRPARGHAVLRAREASRPSRGMCPLASLALGGGRGAVGHGARPLCCSLVAGRGPPRHSCPHEVAVHGPPAAGPRRRSLLSACGARARGSRQLAAVPTVGAGTWASGAAPWLPTWARRPWARGHRVRPARGAWPPSGGRRRQLGLVGLRSRAVAAWRCLLGARWPARGLHGARRWGRSEVLLGVWPGHTTLLSMALGGRLGERRARPW